MIIQKSVQSLLGLKRTTIGLCCLLPVGSHDAISLGDTIDSGSVIFHLTVQSRHFLASATHFIDQSRHFLCSSDHVPFDSSHVQASALDLRVRTGSSTTISLSSHLMPESSGYLNSSRHSGASHSYQGITEDLPCDRTVFSIGFVIVIGLCCLLPVGSHEAASLGETIELLTFTSRHRYGGLHGHVRPSSNVLFAHGLLTQNEKELTSIDFFHDHSFCFVVCSYKSWKSQFQSMQLGRSIAFTFRT